MNEKLEEIVDSETITKKENFLSKVLEVYFRPNCIEKWGNGQIYRYMGVHHFKKIVPTGGDYVNKLIRKKNPNHRNIRNVKGAKEWAKAYRIAESAHLVFGIYLGSIITLEILDHFYGVAAFTTALNLGVNIYPVLLQRYNRTRIYNMIDKYKDNKKVSELK